MALRGGIFKEELDCPVMELATIWRSKDLSTETKVLVYNSMVIGILIHNSETWTLTERLKNKLRAFEMGCLRKILLCQESLTSEIQTSRISSTSSMTLWTGSEAVVLDTSDM